MFIAIDFDNTIVRQDRPYDDTETPLEFVEGAEHGIRALKRAGHVLLLWSGRACRSLLVDPSLDPLVRAGARRIDMEQWKKSQVINIARHKQMLDFVAEKLPGVFDAIDDGAAGKPSVQMFIDDRARCLGRGAGGLTWEQITDLYGSELLPVPRVAQSTDFSCGAAALFSVLKFYKMPVDEEGQLYRILGTNAKTGTAPDRIAKVAEQFGLRANWRTGISVDDLRDAMNENVPVILDIQDPDDGKPKPSLPDGHYVVLCGLSREHAWYMNPSGGKTDRVTVDNLVSRWADVDGVRGGVFVVGRR